MKPFLRSGRRKLHVKVKLPDGTWSRAYPTPYEAGQEREADDFRDQLQARILAGFTPEGPLTVKRYYEKWIKTRDNASKADDMSRMRLHVLPAVGALRMDEVRPRHVRDMVRRLKRELAPRTVYNVYAVLASMMRDAVVDEVIRTSPCVRGTAGLPKKRDRDPEWRASAVFTRAELEQIISDERIPQDRRIFWALMLLTASRFGEVAAIRWRHYDTRPKPLGRLVIAASYNTKLRREKSTKTESTRKVPVHPVLAGILAEWKLRGYAEQFGNPPKVDDLIVPSREGRNRSSNHMLKKFHEDLARIGLRARRQHDAKRTFKSIAQDDGAHSDRLMWITHGRPPGVGGAYDEPSWPALCECVQKMRVYRHGANGATRSNENRNRHRARGAANA